MSVKSCVECSKRAHGKICSWELLTVNIWVWLIRKIEVISLIWVNCNSLTSWSVCKWILLSSTEEDLLSGHPRAAKKVFVPGAGRLRECKKKSLYGSWVRFPKCPLRPPLYNVFWPCQHHMPSPYCSLTEYHCVWLKHRLNPGCV